MDGFTRALHARANDSSAPSNSTSTARFHHLIHQLQVADVVQIRSSLMVTAGFNIAAASIIITSILYDAWKTEKRSLSVRTKRNFSFLHFPCKIHPAEVFPLIFSAVIAMQGLIFLGVQGTGLQSLLMPHCSAISKIVWPAIWLTAYVLLVFGAEIAVRGFYRKRFAARGRWNTSVCMVVVVVLVGLTEIPPQVRPPLHDHCIAGLVWWASFWSPTAIAINFVIIAFYLLIASLIAYQLVRTVKVEREERIAASRMVYYLGVGTILMILVVPFWIQVSRHIDAERTSRIAAVALNIFGLINLFLHLMLRSNSDNMALRPLQAPWAQRKGWRFFGESDLEIGHHMETPVVPEHDGPYRRLVEEKNANPFSPKSDRTMEGALPARRPLSLAPSASRPVTAPSIRHSRKRSAYSLFPMEAPELKRPASSIYADNDGEGLMPPRPTLFRRHRRESSEFSSATVQIGLRLSNFAAPEVSVNAERSISPARRPSRLNQELHRGSDRSLELPIQIKDIPTPVAEKSNPANWPQTLYVDATGSREEIGKVPWPQRSDSVKRKSRRESWLAARDARMKTLPPIPATPDNVRPASIAPGSHPNLPGSPRKSVTQSGGARGEWPLPLRKSGAPSGILLSSKTYQPGPFVPPKSRPWI